MRASILRARIRKIIITHRLYLAAAEIDFECKSQLARADALIETGYKLYELGRHRFVRHLFNIQYLFSDPLRATLSSWLNRCSTIANAYFTARWCFSRCQKHISIRDHYFCRSTICKCIQQV